ncbi:MAG: helix-turn-helix transcriptional regulator [Actinobacteria bacterium]|nr:helix-turn-helix transcriptional regulator [Actinomycetota bacterium]
MPPRRAKRAPRQNQVRKLRERRGLSREQIAVDLNVSYKTVEAWETAEHRAPSSQILPALAELLGATMNEVLGLEPISDETADRIARHVGEVA